MTWRGRLEEHMQEALVLAPGGYRDDIPGPLADLPADQSRAAVGQAVEIAVLYAEELVRSLKQREEPDDE